MATIKTEIASYFKNQEGIVAVYLFGSYATNYARPFSDIDIGIVAEHADIHRIKNQFGRFIIDLGRISRRDIHPVMLNRAPESLLSQIFAKGQCLVVNNRRALSAFRMNKIADIAEFGYFKVRMQEGFIENVMG